MTDFTWLPSLKTGLLFVLQYGIGVGTSGGIWGYACSILLGRKGWYLPLTRSIRSEALRLSDALRESSQNVVKDRYSLTVVQIGSRFRKGQNHRFTLK